MPRDDRFKRYQEAGADFLETARTRAEEFLRELAKLGDSSQKQAQVTVDDLVEGGRKGTELVRRHLAVSRSQAAELIDAGVVLVAGTVAERAGRLVDPAEPVTIAGPPPRFVGRGGEKLDAALEGFRIDVRGRRALDAGA